MTAALSPAKKEWIYRAAIIVLTIAIALASTVYSLSVGIYEVFPFIYFLPIILFIYFYPERGVLFTLALSSVYIALVYGYSGFDPQAVAVSTAWYVVFVTIGVVTSSFAGGLREEERKYHCIFENSQAAIFTFSLDTQQIIECNGKCAQMLRLDRTVLAGQPLSLIIADAADRDRLTGQLTREQKTGDTEMVFTARDGTLRQFLVSASATPDRIAICSAIDITARKMAEQVIGKAKEDLERRVNERTEQLMHSNEELLAEIQERKRFESAIRLANHKFATLSGVTRHDILNQISAMMMYLALVREAESDPVLAGYLAKMDNVLRMVQKQIRFTRDYQAIGESEPRWQEIGPVIREAAAGINLGSIALDVQPGGVEVYADAGLLRVFANLIENTLTHGEHAARIRFSYGIVDQDLVISCEDDGVGVDPKAKGKIFRREYARNTGYGLFLSTEILGITGISMTENGTFGQGARLEIRVPKGGFRFTGNGTRPQDLR